MTRKERADRKATDATKVESNALIHPNARGGLTKDERQEVFLAAYRQLGNVTATADKTGISRLTHYGWMREPEYAAAFEDADLEARDRILTEMRRRAMDGWEEPVFYQGVECGGVRKYSDTLLLALGKAKWPELFRERVDLNFASPEAAKKKLTLLLGIRLEDLPE